MTWGTPRDWSANEPVTAPNFNSALYNDMNYLKCAASYGDWTSETCVLESRMQVNADRVGGTLGRTELTAGTWTLDYWDATNGVPDPVFKVVRNGADDATLYRMSNQDWVQIYTSNTIPGLHTHETFKEVGATNLVLTDSYQDLKDGPVAVLEHQVTTYGMWLLLGKVTLEHDGLDGVATIQIYESTLGANGYTTYVDGIWTATYATYPVMWIVNAVAGADTFRIRAKVADPSFAVTHREVTSNVATLTTATQDIVNGKDVTVSDMADAAYNGTFTVTARTDTSVSYALVHADEVTTADAGSVSVANNGTSTVYCAKSALYGVFLG